MYPAAENFRGPIKAFYDDFSLQSSVLRAHNLVTNPRDSIVEAMRGTDHCVVTFHVYEISGDEAEESDARTK